MTGCDHLANMIYAEVKVKARAEFPAEPSWRGGRIGDLGIAKNSGEWSKENVAGDTVFGCFGGRATAPDFETSDGRAMIAHYVDAHWSELLASKAEAIACVAPDIVEDHQLIASGPKRRKH
jgi:hypothetical protein